MSKRCLVSAKQLSKELNVSLNTVYKASELGEIQNYGLRSAKRFDLNEIMKLK
jgi:hypothetical protein